MNKFGKATLMAGASALALGLAASQASAFEDVDWEWDTDIKEKIRLYIDPSFWQLDPRGLVQVEQLQISVGDIKATSEVKWINNDVANEYGDPVLAEYSLSGYTTGHLDVETGVKTWVKTDVSTEVVGDATGGIHVYGKAKDDCWWGYRGKKCDYDPVKASGYADLDVTGYGTGKGYGHGYGYGKGKTYGSLGVVIEGEIYVPVLVPNTIDDLALVTSTATAIANVASVEGNSAVFVHDGQFSLGDVGKDEYRHIPALELASVESDSNDYGGGGYGYGHKDPADNEHALLAALGLLAAGFDLIQPAHIEATSNVAHINNAAVDSSATAIANVHSIDVEAEYATDVMVIADIVQFSYGDVTANSTVKDVYAGHFEGLGGLENGLVNSVATAIGNVSTIGVNVGGDAAPGE